MAEGEGFRYDVVRDAAYYAAALRHHSRRISRIRWLRRILVATMAGLMALAAIGSVSEGDYGTALFSAAFAIVMLNLVRLSRCLMLFRIRSMPGFGTAAALTIDENGVASESPEGVGSINWNAFSKVYRLPDGLLLYRGHAFFIWLPDDALSGGASPRDATALVAQHAEGFRDFS